METVTLQDLQTFILQYNNNKKSVAHFYSNINEYNTLLQLTKRNDIIKYGTDVPVNNNEVIKNKSNPP